MTPLLLEAFQLGVSAMFSFVGATVLAFGLARLLRLPNGRLRLAVALLPFAKLVYEIGRGVPASGFFWQRLAGAHQELGGFRFGFGLARAVPLVDFSLSARWRGTFYPQSAADVLARAIERRGPASIVTSVGALFLLFVAIGLSVAVVSLARRRPSRSVLDGATLLEVRAIGLGRSARVFASDRWGGVPFASGLWSPIVVLPRRLVESLPDDERRAVVEHEIAHLRGLHAIIAVTVACLRGAFWFVPGVLPVAREVRKQIEVAADDAAVRAGIDPAVLASAVVRVAEILGEASAPPPARHHPPAPGLALFDRRSVLRTRIARLLASDPVSRWPLLVAFARGAGLVLVAAAVLRATTFGNP